MPRSTVESHVAVLVCLAALAGSACAQLRTDPSQWTSGPSGIKRYSDPVIDLRTTTPKPIDPYAYKRGLFASMGLYEYKPEGTVEGRYTRPRYAVGLQSEAMREALSLTGLDAESCIAPMVRLRARQATITGNTGLSMSLLARCTFY
ncbi:MAG: hypothetical protein ACXWVT_05470 [Burkholderiaceae bacterium]